MLGINPFKFLVDFFKMALAFLGPTALLVLGIVLVLLLLIAIVRIIP